MSKEINYDNPVGRKIFESFYGASPTPNLPMDKVWCEEVIISTLTRRGEGTADDDPIRIIIQVFTKDGKLIAEYDPYLTPHKTLKTKATS